MRNFLRVGSGVNVIAARHELQLNPRYWNENKLRTSHPATPHSEVDDIWLRFNDLAPYKDNPAAIVDEHESIAYPAWWGLPECRRLAMSVFAAVQGERLGRVLITRLAPGKRIDPHEDGGSHASYYERVHVVLQGLPGSLFLCGDEQPFEQVQMMTGEVWHFDNSKTHSVLNNSADDRIHMIVDYRVSKC